MRVLVVNAGSSSLKLSLLAEAAQPAPGLAGPEPAQAPGAAGLADRLQARWSPEGLPSASELASWLAGVGRIDAVGHRIVHGGSQFCQPVMVDHTVVGQLEALVDLAPLHQAKGLAALAALRSALPGVPAVACFDTAFHAGMPAPAATYPLPADWRRRWGLRRYGFHGISHAYAARRCGELLGRPAAQLRVVTCHLGAGASLAAVSGGRSVDTTMGFTPLDGLVMATRSGSIDPGLVLWLQTHMGMSAAELSQSLEQRCGLLALAGSGDMVSVLGMAAAGDEAARLALEIYLHRLRALIAAMAAAMGGLDALAFTGGVGQNAPAIRAGAAAGLAFLGIAVDPQRNEQGAPDREIGRSGVPVRCVVVAAREDLEIAREVRRTIRGDAPS